MNRDKKLKLIACLAACLWAGPSNGAELAASTFGSGVTVGTVSTTTVVGTAGQPIVGQVMSTSYTLQSGFWFSGGPAIPSSTPDLGSELPLETALFPTRPNPFYGSTTVHYQLSEDSALSIGVVDASGRNIATLASGRQTAGAHSVTWDGRNSSGSRVATGVYFLQMLAGPKSFTQKLLVQH